MIGGIICFLVGMLLGVLVGAAGAGAPDNYEL